jgi:hypothetical protein
MIKKITIEIGNKEIELTYIEATQLYAELDRVLGKRFDPYPFYPTYPWVVPTVWEPYTIPPYVTYGSDTCTTNSEKWVKE